MKALADPRLYVSTHDCLAYLQRLAVGAAGAAAAAERYHLYWHGAFGRKQAFAVKSFMATQALERCELWLWLDAESKQAGPEVNGTLRPLLPFIRVKLFDAAVEARDTPLERHPELASGADPIMRSNVFRFLILYRYGGTYADMDVMFLRDLRALLGSADLPDEFCYRWAAHPWANSAVLRLRAGSATAAAVLTRCRELGTCRPRQVLGLADTQLLELAVLPSTFFDPLWLHADGQDRYAAAPFGRFRDFFRPFGWRFRRQRAIRSFRDFFAGAFTYHWHNGWDAPERDDSYFGLFDRELDTILRDRLLAPP